jgi:hypothetical protein
VRINCWSCNSCDTSCMGCIWILSFNWLCHRPIQVHH